ncbi:MAG: hypothetical protein KDE22_04435 [Rhodobacterales bacterium]|nr:hypothetical protein [Rhodobacterales bacterium]
MKQTDSSFIDTWNAAAADLGLQITFGFEIKVGTKVVLRPDVFLKDFGHTLGMLVFRRPAGLAGQGEALVQLGYGYSVVDFGGTYRRDSFINMLSDWGWTGNEAERPDWIVSIVDVDKV